MHFALCTLREGRGRGKAREASHRAARACLQVEDPDQSFRAWLINEHPGNSIEHQFMLQGEGREGREVRRWGVG